MHSPRTGIRLIATKMSNARLNPLRRRPWPGSQEQLMSESTTFRDRPPAVQSSIIETPNRQHCTRRIRTTETCSVERDSLGIGPGSGYYDTESIVYPGVTRSESARFLGGNTGMASGEACPQFRKQPVIVFLVDSLQTSWVASESLIETLHRCLSRHRYSCGESRRDQCGCRPKPRPRSRRSLGEVLGVHCAD